MFKPHIENSLSLLTDQLDFNSWSFVYEPKDVLSEIGGSQIVGFYSGKIVIEEENNVKAGFAFARFGVVVLLPENFDVDAVIMNVYSFIKDTRIIDIETDSEKIYKQLYGGDEIKSDSKLILFNCEMVCRVEKLSCCIKMEIEC